MHEVNEDLISKKDLLRLTGISYGQLYRWKRQNLIPEAWFIKQSAFTGQETFFPRDKILKRVQMITDLKDQYSLEELADLFSPSTTKRAYTSAEVSKLPGFSQTITGCFAQALNKQEFNFRELVCIYLCNLLQEQTNINQEELQDVITSLSSWLPKLKSLSLVFMALRRDNCNFSLLVQQQNALYLDHKTEQIVAYDLEELAKDLNLKLNKVWEGR